MRAWAPSHEAAWRAPTDARVTAAKAAPASSAAYRAARQLCGAAIDASVGPDHQPDSLDALEGHAIETVSLSSSRQLCNEEQSNYERP